MALIRRVSAPILKRTVVGAILQRINFESRSRGYIAGTQFSAATDQNLIRQIAAYAGKTMPADDVEDILPLPDGFPFEIVNHSRSLCLRRKFQDEIIDVSVPLDEVTDDPPTFQMIAYIGKSKTQLTGFRITAKPDSIVYNYLSMRDYCNRLLDQFKQFLAVRGINPCTIKSLIDYCQTMPLSQRNHLVEGIGYGFPFEIKDVDFKRNYRLTLRGKYEDETIELTVNIIDQGFLMNVNISCGDDEYTDPSLRSIVRAFADNSYEIAISSMSISEGYTGFQEAFQMFFEKRGIKLSTTNFLFDYIRKLNANLNAKKCFQGIGVERIRQLNL